MIKLKTHTFRKKPAISHSNLNNKEEIVLVSAMMQGGNDMSDGMMSSEVIMVPNKMVGLIIGRGGEQITRLVFQTFF